MSVSIFSAIYELEKNGKSGVLCTIVETHGSTPRHEGSKMLVFEDGSFIGTVGGGEVENRVLDEAQKALHDGKTRLLEYNMADPTRGDPGICGGHLEVYVEPILKRPKLIVVGGGHVGKALAHLAKWLNFYVVVSDDRAELCTLEENPDASEFVVARLSELPLKIRIDEHTYIACVTRGTDVDVEGLPALFQSNACYIGVIGSRRRWENTRKELLIRGVKEDELKKVHTPIGLKIGAETPEEIAVSIMAEIMQVLRGVQ